MNVPSSLSKRLPIPKRLVAALMRRLPINIRPVRMLRDRLYIAQGAGGWDDNEAVDWNWPSQLHTINGRVSGMSMALDLTDWMQRRSYFTGRFYQEDLEELLTCLVRPGDTFVDVGANIGVVTLHAAKLVGEKGKVFAFEPNPDVYTRLKRHIAINGLTNVRGFNKGLGAEAGTLTLNLFGRHTGKATLVPRDGETVRTVSVDISRGDKLLTLNGPTVLKIDVEGYETPVIQGLGDLLDNDVVIVIEVSHDWLKRAGSSAVELHELIEAHGLKPYRFELVQSRMTRKLVVEPIDEVLPDEQYDCLFMRPESCFAKRLGTTLHPSMTGRAR